MLGIKINKRQEPLVWSSCLILFGALVLSLAVSAIMLALQNKPPLVAMAVLFKGAFGS
jgi:simple sugar transport system permease protein